MTFPNSAGVYAREIDASITTIQQSGSPAAFVGEFNWGPVNKRKLITDETQLAAIFRQPILNDSIDFFIAAQFLAYANQLYVVRCSSGANAVAKK